MTLTTYAQMMEDILLYRAFRDIDPSEGFYIDVGGYHPIYHSVTKLFYDLGWSGVNIEPGRSQFPSFVDERVRDTNLQVALSDHEGTAQFFEMDQTSTLEGRFLKNSDTEPESYSVPVTTLNSVFLQHARDEVHFLKIDVEGHEAAVIRGWDRKKFRPWVVVIEAFEPNRLDKPTHDEWEFMMLGSDYKLAGSDTLNRYYIAQEHLELEKYFSLPADDFHKSWDIWRCLEVERQRDQLKSLLDQANTLLASANLTPVGDEI